MSIVVGLDEVGRGCWAGPLVAAAVVLGKPIVGLDDSKKLSAAQRQRLNSDIEADALAIGLGWVSPADVDAGGLTAAVKRAMTEAIKAINVPYDVVIIDGNYNFLSDALEIDQLKIQTVIRADGSVPAVSAASIIAKVARDNYMCKAAQAYPGYGFERHVGYGTAEHRTALKQLGVCPLHRRSYKPIQKVI